jgi:phosphoribosylglycinamide formyltransferase-1
VSTAARVGVLVSGAGSNLQALIDQLHPEVVEIVGVASNRADAGALERARGAGLACAVFELSAYSDRESRDAAMAAWLVARGASLVVCAGYMHLLTAPFRDRLTAVNVHPSLLPAFPGRTPIEDALAAGVAETGVTVHLIDAGMDTGPVLRQERVAVNYDDSGETLRARIQAVEHRLLPQTVRDIVEGRIELRGVR